MNIENKIKNNRLMQNWNGLGSSARWFLFSTVLNSFFLSGWFLYFNFFILARGFDLKFLGLIQSVPSMAALLVGIPIGMMADRIGRKKAFVIGILFASGASIMKAIVVAPWLIVTMAFLSGVGMIMYFVNMNPMLMRLSTKENRNMLFSLNWALLALAGVAGSYLAGQLPGWIEDIFGHAPGTLESYQTVLIISMAFSALSVIPILFINFGETQEKKAEREFPDLRLILRNKTVIKIFLPSLTLGIGAAMLVPKINLFFVEKFNVNDSTLGMYFALASLVTGISTLFIPMLAKRFNGRINAITFTQVSSLVFLILLGFSPWRELAVVGFLLRGALMNMAVPLWDAFVMEQVAENEQATVASIQHFAWEAGWATVPFISGIIQQKWGFTPLFIITGVFYLITSVLTYGFFHKTDQAAEKLAELEARAA